MYSRQEWCRMKRLLPDSVAARTLLVLIIGLTVSQILSLAFYLTDRTSTMMFTGGRHISERIVTITQLVEGASQAERERIVDLADQPELHVSIGLESAIEDQKGGGWQTQVLRDALNSHFASEGSVGFRLRRSLSGTPNSWQAHVDERHETKGFEETLLVSLPLPDNSWLNFAAPIQSPEPFWSFRFGLSILVMVTAVAVLSALVVRHLTKPLAVVAKAARRLGIDVKAPPLLETGPSEVRQVARAFNEMQERIRRFVEDRTQMVAAISHDLGTPITRMRLRAEFVEDPEQQKKMLADLDEMEKMVFSTLSFARDEAEGEPLTMVDLRSLLQRVCDDAGDAGQSVTAEIGTEAVPLGCRPVALRRALANLIDNAVKYGDQALVSLFCEAKYVVIRIEDTGPGIPEELREELFKPFRRVEVSRSRETGGTGLGLTVARTIVRAHGGDIQLGDREEGGLRVDVRLPR